MSGKSEGLGRVGLLSGESKSLGGNCQERKQKAAEEGAGDRATGMGTVGCNDESERTTRWVLHFDLRVRTRQADEWV